MSEYFVLNRLVSRGDIFIEEYKAARVYDFEYYKGIPIKTQRPLQLFYKYKSHRKTDYISGIHSFPVISSWFRELLFKLNVQHIELHPAELICTKTKEKDKSYSFLNILNNVSCVDRKRSEFETFGMSDEIVEVTKLVIKPTALTGRDLARIAEIPEIILVSTRLRAAIEAEKLSGMEFQKIEDFQLL